MSEVERLAIVKALADELDIVVCSSDVWERLIEGASEGTRIYVAMAAMDGEGVSQ